MGLLRQGRDLGFKLRDPIVGTRQRPESPGGLGQEGRDVRVGRAVLPLELLERRDRLPDLLQPLGVGEQRFTVGADVPCQLGCLRREAASPLGNLAGRRVELGRGLQRPPDLTLPRLRGRVGWGHAIRMAAVIDCHRAPDRIAANTGNST